MNTTESHSPTSGSIARSLTIRTVPADAQRIDFNRVRTEKTTTWDSALNTSVAIEHGGREDLFLVDDGSDGFPRNCSLARRSDDTHTGWCSCRGFDAAGVCPHLCTLRQRSTVGELELPTLVNH